MLFYVIGIIILLAEWTAGKDEEKFLPFLKESNDTVEFDIPFSSEVQKDLVKMLVGEGYRMVQSDAVARVMALVDISLFEPEDEMLPKYGYALEKLHDHLKAGYKALDVGKGSGYLAVCMSLMVGSTGYAVGVPFEFNRKEWKKAINKFSRLFLERKRIILVDGDVQMGAPEHGPYDAINVGYISKEDPEELLNQLQEGGRLVMTVTENLTGVRSICILDKLMNGTIVRTYEKGPYHALDD